MIYTSGSTGVPKGVAVGHRNLVNYTCFIQKRLELERFPEGLQFATVSALQADLGHTAIFPALVSGGTVHVIPQDVATDSKALGEYFEQHRIDVLKIVPSHMRALLESDGARKVLPRKYLIFGGEALTRALVERIESLNGECEVLNHYGPTETTVGSLTLRLNEYDWKGSAARTIPIGRPIANTQIYILDAHMEPALIGVAWELYIAGDGVSEGYLNQPDRTAERFIRNPFGEGVCYRTGDLARYLEDGAVEFLGRADEQVKIRGYRIEPGEVEVVLLRHRGVEQAAVVPRVDARGDLRLVAYVVIRPQETATSEELERHLQNALPDYMIPSAVVRLQKLPLNANGKLDRKALPSPEAVEQKVYEPPVTQTEVALAAIWAEVLKRGPIGRNDHFFHLGGHSLLATQVVSRIRREFRIDLALRTIFESPTVAQLAAQIEEAAAVETERAPAIVPVGRDQDLPLSFAQQRLWILDQLEPDNPLYNIARALRIRGQLEAGVLERALNEIVRRHESQRTTFGVHAGEPVQVIAESAEIALPVTDITGLAETEREAATREAAEQEALKPFSLATGPLLRAHLFRMDSDDHVLLLTMHHIVSDAWSASVFIKELGALYNAFVHNQPSPLNPLRVQYADYAVWQRQWLSGGVFQKQMAYWKKHLAGAPPVLTLPGDRPRPEKPSFEGSYETVALGKELSRRLEQLSHEEGATLFMTLLAGFDALLGRLSGAEQIVVGTDVANRPNAEAEALIGFFVNLLPLRTDLSGNPTFRELIGRVRDVALGAYAHQEMPFDRLVEAMQPDRRSSHTPIVQVLFVMQNVPQAERRLGDLEWSPFRMPVRRSKFDLAVFMIEGPDGLVGHWLYSTDSFDRETILRFAHNWETLLEQATVDPDRRLSGLGIWTEEERQEQERMKKEKKRSQRSRLVTVEAKAIDWVEMSQA